MTKSRARKFAELLDGSDNIKSARLSNVSSVGGATGVDFNDSVKAQFGNADDLQIYHDGSHSYINDTGTGNLKIRAANFEIQDSSGTNTIISAVSSDGEARLNYGGSMKLNTASDGVIVNGNLRVGDTGTGNLQAVTGQYGSVQVDGGAKGGYEGYSIGGRVVLMHNNNTATGIYNDVDNHWLYHSTHGGSSYMYFNGSNKIQTTSYGMALSGNPWCWAEGSNNLRVDLRQGSAKVWAKFDMEGTYATNDSYNVSSLTDNGRGRGTCNYNNDMTNGNRSVVGTASVTGSTQGNRQFTVGHPYGYGHSPNEVAGSNRISIVYSTGGSNQVYDAAIVSEKVHGDLA